MTLGPKPVECKREGGGGVVVEVVGQGIGWDGVFQSPWEGVNWR